MTTHLGGPESAEKLAERQAMFEGLAEAGTGMMYTIVDAATGEKVGSVGYWDTTWRDEAIYEMGWFVIPDFQRRGVASAATSLAIDLVRGDIDTPPCTPSPRSTTRRRTRSAGNWASNCSGDARSSTPPAGS